MFLWGFSFAVPFYIPPSMFALARGRKESSATISDVFDVVGFIMLALFNGYVASIQHNNITAVDQNISNSRRMCHDILDIAKSGNLF
jgi:hypothetical protein